MHHQRDTRRRENASDIMIHYQPHYLTFHLCQLGMQQESLLEVHLSGKIFSSSATSLSSPFLFSLCGVEGMGVLPQVAEATDAVATLLVGCTPQRKGKVGAVAAAVQSSTATCGCKSGCIYSPPPPPPRCGCWSWRA